MKTIPKNALTENQGKILLKLARSSIASEFTGKKADISVDDSILDEKRGVFVTLTISGELRGCIGFTAPIYPLKAGVSHAAKAAAFEDPRFAPLSEKEFAKIKIDISVLTLPEEIVLSKGETNEALPKHVVIGEDGLIVEFSGRSGLLLPQVFPEWNASPKQALEMTCEKAGLPRDCWKKRDCKFKKFQAQVFRE